MRLVVPYALAPHEHVIPLGFDGEFFLPLGEVAARTAGETVLAIDRLPPPLADSRSLSGAIKIFFQKVIGRVVGLDFPFPILAAHDLSGGQAQAVTSDPFHVGKKVAAAKRILLLVHGIIGATDTMLPGLELAWLPGGQPLASLYDAVLTFDYENLATSIEENGKLLKTRLEGVGLVPGHGKTLEIVAHSMGGLVSRWFIEQEGGKQVVHRLVMLGTPNGGSPWPRVFDWATVTLGLAMNHFTVIPWTAAALGGLAALMENPTAALNEMQHTSGLIAKLKSSYDPGVEYFVVAGNTPIIEGPDPSAVPANDGRLARLLARLTSPGLLHSVANPFFFGQPNDVAVAVNSMEDIAARWRPKDVKLVACDHLSYFQDTAGLEALVDVLSRP